MAYWTQGALHAICPPETVRQLSNDDPEAVDADWALVEALGLAVDGEIDAALRASGLVAVLPLPAPPALVVSLSARLLRCALYRRRPETALPDAVESDCADGRRMLGQLAAGTLDIGPPAQPPATGPGWVVRAAAPRLDLSGY
jgi:hypothetical protein